MKLPSANLRLAGVYCLLWALAGTTSAVACICNGPPRDARNAALFERALRAGDIAETEVTELVTVRQEDFAHKQRASFVVNRVWRGAVQPGASYSGLANLSIAGCADLVNVGERYWLWDAKGTPGYGGCDPIGAIRPGDAQIVDQASVQTLPPPIPRWPDSGHQRIPEDARIVATQPLEDGRELVAWLRFATADVGHGCPEGDVETWLGEVHVAIRDANGQLANAVRLSGPQHQPSVRVNAGFWGKHVRWEELPVMNLVDTCGRVVQQALAPTSQLNSPAVLVIDQLDGRWRAWFSHWHPFMSDAQRRFVLAGNGGAMVLYQVKPQS